MPKHNSVFGKNWQHWISTLYFKFENKASKRPSMLIMTLYIDSLAPNYHSTSILKLTATPMALNLDFGGSKLALAKMTWF